MKPIKKRNRKLLASVYLDPNNLFQVHRGTEGVSTFSGTGEAASKVYEILNEARNKYPNGERNGTKV